MFVPVDLLKPIMTELRARGSSAASTRAWLGLNCQEQDGRVSVVRVSPTRAPASAAPAFAIRKPAVAVFTLDDYVAAGIMTGDSFFKLGNVRDTIVSTFYRLVRDDEILRPLYPDEALVDAAMSDRNFVVFHNQRTHKLAIMYRRKDGEYGLIEPEIGLNGAIGH